MNTDLDIPRNFTEFPFHYWEGRNADYEFDFSFAEHFPDISEEDVELRNGFYCFPFSDAQGNDYTIAIINTARNCEPDEFSYPNNIEEAISFFSTIRRLGVYEEGDTVISNLTSLSIEFVAKENEKILCPRT